MFIVNGSSDGIKVFVEINETKITVEVFFVFYREMVKIEHTQAYETIIACLENFLANVKNKNKKEELIFFAGLSWDKFRMGKLFYWNCNGISAYVHLCMKFNYQFTVRPEPISTQTSALNQQEQDISTAQPPVIESQNQLPTSDVNEFEP